jgi:hypothetical protein
MMISAWSAKPGLPRCGIVGFAIPVDRAAEVVRRLMGPR